MTAVLDITDVQTRQYYRGKEATEKRDVFGPLVNHRCCFVADAIQLLPFFRDVLLRWTDGGGLPCNKQFVLSWLSQGKSAGLLPGGFFETSRFTYAKEEIYIKRVKGFIKYCLVCFFFFFFFVFFVESFPFRTCIAHSHAYAAVLCMTDCTDCTINLHT